MYSYSIKHIYNAIFIFHYHFFHIISLVNDIHCELSRAQMEGKIREWMKRNMKAVVESRRLKMKMKAYSAAFRRSAERHLQPNSYPLITCDHAFFYLLWLMEAMVMVATACFFFFFFRCIPIQIQLLTTHNIDYSHLITLWASLLFN